MKIGLSLSFCVRDIIKGKVDADEVLCIVANTMVSNDVDFFKVVETYSNVYWVDDPYEGKKVAMRFWREGLIVQPRLRGKHCHYVGDGHWLEVESAWHS